MKRLLSPFIALQHRDFRLLWLGLIISLTGSQMQIMAINWQVYILTGSALSLGFVGLARFLPLLVFAPLSGIASDIFSRKKIMFISQFIMIISSLALAVFTFTGNISPLLIYILIGISSAASVFDIPARQSIIPHLVPKHHFMNAVSLNTLIWQVSVVLGPSIAGFIIASSGVASIYFIHSLSLLGVVIALIAMSPIRRNTEQKTNFNFSAIREGFSFVKKTPLIYSTMLLDFFATFFSSATVLLPLFAKDILAVGPQGLGILYAAPSVGAFFAGLVISSMNQLRNQGKILIFSVLLYGVATILFGISQSFYLSLLFLALTGVGDVISAIIRNTIRQLATPDHLRGRMVSINMIFFAGGPQLGEFEAGVLAAAIGAPASVVIGGIGTIIATIILAICTPQLKTYKGNELIV